MALHTKRHLPFMKEVDSLFKVMFRNIYYTGSFFDGLRIENPDEFDLNIVLDLKLPKQSFQLVKNQLCSAGYVQLQVDSPERTVSMNMPMYGLVNKFIISDRLTTCFHQFFSRIFLSFKK